MSEEHDKSIEFVAKYTDLKPVIVENVVRTTVNSSLKGFVEARVLVEMYRPCVNCGHPKTAHCNGFKGTCCVCLCEEYVPDMSMEDYHA